MALPVLAGLARGAGTAFRGAGGLPGIQNIVEQVKKQQPQLTDEVVVQVDGHPGHSKQQLYFLALAAANGVVRRKFNLGITSFLSPPYALLQIEYDAASNWVRCTIRYRFGMAAAGVANLLDLSAPHLFDLLAVYRGPQCEVVGGNFDFVSETLPGLPPNPTSPKSPQLPFEGQVILTSCPETTEPRPKAIVQNPAPSYPIEAGGAPIPSPNPKPPGDNRSRGAVVVKSGEASLSGGVPGQGAVAGVSGSGYGCCTQSLALIPLVYAALSAPATNAHMTFPPPVPGPKGG